jgi:hypothetical protein
MTRRTTRAKTLTSRSWFRPEFLYVLNFARPRRRRRRSIDPAPFRPVRPAPLPSPRTVPALPQQPAALTPVRQLEDA